MNNGLIIDAAFALVLILGALLGAKRGLVRSLMGVITVIAALIGAALLANLLAQPVTQALMPRAEQSIESWLVGASAPPASAEEDPAPQEEPAADPDPLSEVTGLLGRLLRIDRDGALRDSLREHAQDAACAAVRSLMESLVRALLFLAAFLVLSLLLRLFTGGLDKVFSLPILHTVNSLGGGALGLVEAALLLFLVCDVAPRLGIAALSQYEGTYLLAFFTQQTPRSVAAALIPRS